MCARGRARGHVSVPGAHVCATMQALLGQGVCVCVCVLYVSVGISGCVRACAYVLWP